MIEYQVIVDSDSPQTFQQVRQVAPQAFLSDFADGRTRIQAGAFARSASAQEQVDSLAKLGIQAAAYAVNLNIPKGYYAIVPVDKDQIGITFEALGKLGIPENFIIVGQSDSGWNVAVGVYTNRSDTEKMASYLREKGGFDARSYYQE